MEKNFIAQFFIEKGLIDVDYIKHHSFSREDNNIEILSCYEFQTIIMLKNIF